MNSTDSTKIARKILGLVSSLTHSYGVTTLAKILTGRPSKPIVRKRFHEDVNFGALSDYSYKQVLGFLGQLIANGYLERMNVGDDIEIIVVRLTDKGSKAIKDKEEISLSVPQRYDAEFTSAHDF